MTDNSSGLRPAPDPIVIAGALVSLAGYLLPWFKISERYRWWISGWGYTSVDSGGGWTLLTIVLLLVAAVAGVWARGSVAPAMIALVSGVAGMLFAVFVVAASFARFPDRSTVNWVGEMPFGLGLPLMALGMGTLLAGAGYAVVRAALDDRFGRIG